MGSRDTASPGRLWLDFSTACELSISTPSKTNASSGWPPGPPIYHHLIYIKALSPLITKTNKKIYINRTAATGGRWVGCRGLPAFRPSKAPGLQARGARRACPTGRQFSQTLSSQDRGGSRRIPGQQVNRSSRAPLGGSHPELTPASLVLPETTSAGVVQGNSPGRQAGAVPASAGWRPCGPRVGRRSEATLRELWQARLPHVWGEGSSWGRS